MNTEKDKGFTLSIVLLLVVLVGTIVYLFYQNTKIRWFLPVPTEETLTIQPTQVSNTSDWKTYTNEEYGFEIKLPQNYQQNKSDERLEVYSPPVTCETGVTGSITKTQVNQVKLTFISHLGINYNSIWEEAFGHGFDGGDGDMLLNGTKVYYYYQSSESLLNRIAYLIPQSPNKAIEVNIYTPNLVQNCDTEINFFSNEGNQILSTFKFINSETTPATESLFCGGIMGRVCPEGYVCKLDGNYPDAGGTCVKN